MVLSLAESPISTPTSHSSSSASSSVSSSSSSVTAVPGSASHKSADLLRHRQLFSSTICNDTNSNSNSAVTSPANSTASTSNSSGLPPFVPHSVYDITSIQFPLPTLGSESDPEDTLDMNPQGSSANTDAEDLNVHSQLQAQTLLMQAESRAQAQAQMQAHAQARVQAHAQAQAQAHVQAQVLALAQAQAQVRAQAQTQTQPQNRARKRPLAQAIQPSSAAAAAAAAAAGGVSHRKRPRKKPVSQTMSKEILTRMVMELRRSQRWAIDDELARSFFTIWCDVHEENNLDYGTKNNFTHWFKNQKKVFRIYNSAALKNGYEISDAEGLIHFPSDKARDDFVQANVHLAPDLAEKLRTPYPHFSLLKELDVRRVHSSNSNRDLTCKSTPKPVLLSPSASQTPHSSSSHSGAYIKQMPPPSQQQPASVSSVPSTASPAPLVPLAPSASPVLHHAPSSSSTQPPTAMNTPSSSSAQSDLTALSVQQQQHQQQHQDPSPYDLPQQPHNGGSPHDDSDTRTASPDPQDMSAQTSQFSRQLSHYDLASIGSFAQSLPGASDNNLPTPMSDQNFGGGLIPTRCHDAAMSASKQHPPRAPASTATSPYFPYPYHSYCQQQSQQVPTLPPQHPPVILRAASSSSTQSSMYPPLSSGMPSSLYPEQQQRQQQQQQEQLLPTAQRVSFLRAIDNLTCFTQDEKAQFLSNYLPHNTATLFEPMNEASTEDIKRLVQYTLYCMEKNYIRRRSSSSSFSPGGASVASAPCLSATLNNNSQDTKDLLAMVSQP